jgi:hypothetical protein
VPKRLRYNPGVRVVLAIVAVLGLAAVAGTVARADTAPLADSPDLPWTNPDHTSALEVLLSKLASTIAGKDVTIRCEGDTDWRKLVTERGGDPDAELGYVGVDYSRGGRLRTISSFAELTGESVCLPLKRFAVAATKPTKCTVVTLKPTKVYVQKVVNGVKKRVPKTVYTRLKTAMPCYAGSLHSAREMSQAYWNAYGTYSNAILTLAHESIHLKSSVGDLYDPAGEAKASCWGMQWMPYIAQQLGATADDARAIAQYYWDVIYPQYKTGAYNQYWSSDCRAGGSLDLHLPGKTSWP